MRLAIPPLSGRAVVQVKSAEAACSDSILPRRAAAGGPQASGRSVLPREGLLCVLVNRQGGAASLKSQPLFEGNFGLRNASCHCEGGPKLGPKVAFLSGDQKQQAKRRKKKKQPEVRSECDNLQNCNGKCPPFRPNFGLEPCLTSMTCRSS